MMIPLVTRATEEMIRTVPNALREAALALGYSQWRTSLTIVLRTALPGIATGALVAIARIGGETAPLLFTAFGNQFWSVSPGTADRRAAAPDLPVRDQPVRRMARPGLGRRGGPDRAGARHQPHRAIRDAVQVRGGQR